MNRLFLANRVEASLMEPLLVEGEPHPLRCFIRIYYVWARDRDEAEAFISLDLSRDAHVVDIGEIEEVRFDDVRDGVREAIDITHHRGVCWRSGRLFFPCDSKGPSDEAGPGPPLRPPATGTGPYPG